MNRVPMMDTSAAASVRFCETDASGLRYTARTLVQVSVLLGETLFSGQLEVCVPLSPLATGRDFTLGPVRPEDLIV